MGDCVASKALFIGQQPSDGHKNPATNQTSKTAHVQRVWQTTIFSKKIHRKMHSFFVLAIQTLGSQQNVQDSFLTNKTRTSVWNHGVPLFQNDLTSSVTLSLRIANFLTVFNIFSCIKTHGGGSQGDRGERRFSLGVLPP